MIIKYFHPYEMSAALQEHCRSGATGALHERRRGVAGVRRSADGARGALQQRRRSAAGALQERCSRVSEALQEQGR